MTISILFTRLDLFALIFNKQINFKLIAKTGNFSFELNIKKFGL